MLETHRRSLLRRHPAIAPGNADPGVLPYTLIQLSGSVSGNGGEYGRCRLAYGLRGTERGTGRGGLSGAARLWRCCSRLSAYLDATFGVRVAVWESVVLSLGVFKVLNSEGMRPDGWSPVGSLEATF